jgi:ERF superfamily
MFAALAKLQSGLPKVVKDKTAKVPMKSGGSYSYKYADLASVTEQILPRLAENGLAFIARPTLNEAGKLVLAYSLVHESGEREDGEYPLTGGSPQEIGGAITYARRYALCAATGIAADEDDDAALAEQGYRQSAGEAFESARSAAARQKPTAQGHADLGDWEVKIAAVSTMDEASAARDELNALYDKGALTAEKANEIQRALTARVALIRGPRPVPSAQPEQPQAAPEGDDSAEGAFVRDFAAKVGEAQDTDTLRSLKIQLAKAVQAKHVTPETANDLTGSIKNRENELRSAA